jgi:methionyl-tRNA formyltransferase
MKLIFAGTPVFAQLALQALHEAGHDISLVLTRPDKPAQRGQKLIASPVKQWAQTQGIEVWQPRTLRDPEVTQKLRGIGCQAMVVAAYGLLLPLEVLSVPPLGCLNIHASLLPRWRGAAPIQRAVQAGDPQTGITIMQMDVGLDTGPIRLVRPLPIGRDETSGSVHDRLAALGALAIVEAISLLEADRLPMAPQPADGITHAAKIVKSDSLIDWSRPAQAIVDQLRAFDPAPGCVAELARLPAEQLRALHETGALDVYARHPSQLYQMALEGIVMMAILLLYSRKPRPRYAVSGLFALLYGGFRFAVEFVREPDAHLGYLAFGWLTMGQLLSLPLVVLGLFLLWLSRRAPTLAPSEVR